MDEWADDPTCFYCQKAAGIDAKDELLHCAEFDCNRSVHMKCCTPPLSKVRRMTMAIGWFVAASVRARGMTAPHPSPPLDKTRQTVRASVVGASQSSM